MRGRQVSITVVMPVYDALPFLDAAIESILAQTCGDLRLAIYDDHSSDGSYECAREWAARDNRVSVVRGEVRLGPCASSNAAAALAETELVARMDADDVSAPNRLERQLRGLRDNPDAVLIGSTFDMIDGAGRRIRGPTPSRILRRAPPFAHATIMYRKRDFDAVGGYRPQTDYFEDLDLYRRLAQRGRLLVVNAPLLSLRFAGQNARLRDNRQDVLSKIDRQYRGNLQFCYPDAKVSDMAYYSLAVLSILALERPRMLGEMLRQASFARPLRGALILGVVGVAEVSPRLARSLGKMTIALREWIDASRSSNSTVLEWSPRG